jgi:hypothetical protein
MHSSLSVSIETNGICIAAVDPQLSPAIKIGENVIEKGHKK